MTTNAFSGVGTVFKRSITSSGSSAYSAISEINSIGGPNKTRETIDVTSLDSTGGYKEFITSFRDAGEVTLSMNFTQAGYSDLNSDFESDNARLYKIIFNDTNSTTLDFSAYVTGISKNTPMDDKVTMEITMKVTGQVNLTS